MTSHEMQHTYMDVFVCIHIILTHYKLIVQYPCTFNMLTVICTIIENSEYSKTLYIYAMKVSNIWYNIYVKNIIPRVKNSGVRVSNTTLYKMIERDSLQNSDLIDLILSLISSQSAMPFFPRKKTQHTYRHTIRRKRQDTTTNTAKQLQHKHAGRILHTQIKHNIYTCIKINHPKRWLKSKCH